MNILIRSSAVLVCAALPLAAQGSPESSSIGKLKQRALANDWEAMQELPLRLLAGDGCKSDPKEALRWAEQSTVNGRLRDSGELRLTLALVRFHLEGPAGLGWQQAIQRLKQWTAQPEIWMHIRTSCQKVQNSRIGALWPDDPEWDKALAAMSYLPGQLLLIEDELGKLGGFIPSVKEMESLGNSGLVWANYNYGLLLSKPECGGNPKNDDRWQQFEGRQRLRQAAEKGHALASWECYWDGSRTWTDPWLRKAAEGGVLPAQMMLHPLWHQPTPEAWEIYIAASRQGHVVATRAIAQQFQDKGVAFPWWVRASEQGDHEASWFAYQAQAARNGRLRKDRPLDSHQAHLLEDAANKTSNAEAAWEWAMALDLGAGVQSDRVESHRMKGLAAERGLAEARFWLGAWLSDGSESGAKAAVPWLRGAATSGHERSRLGLAWAYIAGRGLPRDLIEARKLLLSMNGYGLTDEELSELLALQVTFQWNGEGGPRKRAEAVYRLSGLAKNGNTRATREHTRLLQQLNPSERREYKRLSTGGVVGGVVGGVAGGVVGGGVGERVGPWWDIPSPQRLHADYRRLKDAEKVEAKPMALAK